MKYAKQQKMSEWLKSQVDYLGFQGETFLDPGYSIDRRTASREAGTAEEMSARAGSNPPLGSHSLAPVKCISQQA